MSRSQLVLGESNERLSRKVVAVVGVGGTGCTAALLLSRIGLKKLILIDRDVVEKSNLERQMLFSKEDIGKGKVLATKEKLSSFCNVEARFIDLNFRNIDFAGIDLVVDCTDNMETRFLINDYCKKNGIPWVYTGAIGRKGGVYFNGVQGPCFACFSSGKYGETCSAVGVLNSTVTLVGSWAVAMVVDYLALRKKESNLININLENNMVSKLKIKKNPACDACNEMYHYLEGENVKKITRFCSDRFQFSLPKEIDLKEMNNKLSKLGSVVSEKSYLHFGELMIFRDRVLIKASSESLAKKKYDEVIGI